MATISALSAGHKDADPIIALGGKVYLTLLIRPSDYEHHSSQILLFVWGFLTFGTVCALISFVLCSGRIHIQGSSHKPRRHPTISKQWFQLYEHAISWLRLLLLEINQVLYLSISSDIVVGQADV